MRRLLALVKQLPDDAAVNRGKVWTRQDEMLALLLEQFGVELKHDARAAAKPRPASSDPRRIAQFFATGR